MKCKQIQKHYMNSVSVITGPWMQHTSSFDVCLGSRFSRTLHVHNLNLNQVSILEVHWPTYSRYKRKEKQEEQKRSKCSGLSWSAVKAVGACGRCWVLVSHKRNNKAKPWLLWTGPLMLWDLMEGCDGQRQLHKVSLTTTGQLWRGRNQIMTGATGYRRWMNGVHTGWDGWRRESGVIRHRRKVAVERSGLLDSSEACYDTWFTERFSVHSTKKNNK